MADAGPAYEPYLSRLHMRVAGRAFDKSMKNEKISDVDLRAHYTHSGYIRSKYKGRRAAPAADAAAPVGVTGKTSGIPIFNAADTVDRAGWSKGHAMLRAETTASLRAEAKKRGMSDNFIARHVTAENSHALGHGDYGTDHELSAPAGSKAQNTEQLAIELAMREAAGKLNATHADKDQSLVHAKITDVLHPHTGQLIARRFKLIRRENLADTDGTVVFDRLMDGQRMHISKDEAFDLGRHVHDALMADSSSRVAAGNAVHPAAGTDRKGLATAEAPTRKELHDHQAAVLEALQSNKGKNPFAAIKDREGVNMAGPALTEVQFPKDDTIGAGTGIGTGQAALDIARRRAVLHHVSAEHSEAQLTSDFLTSGSVPADPTTKMIRGMQSLQASVYRELHTEEPTKGMIDGYRPEALSELFERHNEVTGSGGDHSLLDPGERQLLSHIDALQKRHQAAPPGTVYYADAASGSGGSSSGGYMNRVDRRKFLERRKAAEERKAKKEAKKAPRVTIAGKKKAAPKRLVGAGKGRAAPASFPKILAASRMRGPGAAVAATKKPARVAKKSDAKRKRGSESGSAAAVVAVAAASAGAKKSKRLDGSRVGKKAKKPTSKK